MNGIPLTGDRLLVLFDGHCGLCNRTVQWLLRRDRDDRLRFASFESPQGGEVLARHGIGTLNPDSGPASVVVVRDLGGVAERVLVRSEAVLALLTKLPRPWPGVAATLRWIPLPIRDRGYKIVAHWRNTIWGRLENCPIPGAKERVRFL